jgi:methionine sulfoxide reductase heme-binding subunit
VSTLTDRGPAQRAPTQDGPATLRSALIVLVLGALTVLVFYLPFRHLQAHDRSAPALEMSSMHMNRGTKFWAVPLLQASGFAALIWAYLGLTLGLLEPAAAARSHWLPFTGSTRVRLHRQISLLVLGLILVHAIATACDAMGDNIVTAFVPFEETYKPVVWSFDLGIFALYLGVLVGPTYYARRLVGTNRWRTVHRLAGVVYLLALWHALLIGDDVAHYPWVHPLIWLLQIPLLLLFAQRLVVQAQASRASGGGVVRAISLALAAVAALGVIGIVVLVASGSYSSFIGSNPF